MKTMNLQKITAAIQELIRKGELTLLGENVVYWSKSGAYKVGIDPNVGGDVVDLWRSISAYQHRDNS